MSELEFAGKRIVILGLARQGVALARFFVAAGAQVTVSDAAPATKLASEQAKLADLPVTFVLGEHPATLLDGCDLLCLSGGVPAQLEIVRQAVARGIPLSNDSLLTFQLAKARGLGPIIALTGSSGKTTTTTLVGKMLAASGLPVHVGGNIGTPLIDRLDSIRPGDRIVLELSSFQLELFDAAVAWGDLTAVGPAVSAILNVTPNHLDRHPHMAAYAAAKFNLLRHLPAQAAVVLNADDGVTAGLLEPALMTDAQQQQVTAWALNEVVTELRSALTAAGVRRIPFSRARVLETGAWRDSEQLLYDGQTICQSSEVKLRGEHNFSNLLAAAAISGAAGATVAGMGEVARTFAGVAHRLEVVAERNGVTWINDSIATAPERAVAGLQSFPPTDGAIILLAGGKDKNLPWEAFADEVLMRVSYLIGFGQAGPMIVEKVQEQAHFRRSKTPSSAITQRLDEAVELAARVAGPGTVVLLSPGGTSYDAYRDFEERGEHFRRLVAAVTEQSTVACGGAR